MSVTKSWIRRLPVQVIADITYNSHDQKLDLVLPEGNRFDAVFIYFHGGGLTNGKKNPEAKYATYLASHNVAVATANYRMYPNAKFPDFIEDAADCVAWVKDHIGDYGTCDKIFVGGSSAGGYLSMMLCFDEHYLGRHGIKPTDLAGFYHDAGQPTSHFNVLKERGLDSRRLIVDETAPLYFIGHNGTECPRMFFLVSDNDMENRYEQTMLTLSTLKHFRYDMDRIGHKVLHGTHCHQVGEVDEQGESVFGKLIHSFITDVLNH